MLNQQIFVAVAKPEKKILKETPTVFYQNNPVVVFEFFKNCKIKNEKPKNSHLP